MKNRCLLVALVFAGLAGECGSVVFAGLPNLIVFLADDLGWTDLPSYGNAFNETPHLDRLAREGMRFTQFYAGPVCSPTRANLQSGQDQARFGITQHIPGHRRPFARLIDPEVPDHLPLEVEVFAERIAVAGYATGYFGKWHLGRDEFGPDRQGWQTTFVWNRNDVPPKVTGEAQTRRSTDYLKEKAIDFIEAHQDQPFLLQVSYNAVHLPLSTTPELLAKYRQKPPVAGYPSLPAYAGLIEELDQSIGAIVDTIDRLKLAEKTLVLFLSDNGGLEHRQNGQVVTSNAPLRGEKGTLYEGGIRVPAIARWLGQIPAGTVCDIPATTIDLYPTLVELAGVTLPDSQPVDGVSLVRVFKNPNVDLPRETLFWHLPHYHHSTPASAIRYRDWKLIEFYEGEAVELYDLKNDLGEANNVAVQHPEKTAELRTALSVWREKVGARLPQPNPNFDPAREREMGQKGQKNEE